jgi:hypothetical protein
MSSSAWRKHVHDLGLSKSALLHRNLHEHLAEKILLLKSLIRGEDYHAVQVGAAMPTFRLNPPSDCQSVPSHRKHLTSTDDNLIRMPDILSGQLLSAQLFGIGRPNLRPHRLIGS